MQTTELNSTYHHLIIMIIVFKSTHHIYITPSCKEHTIWNVGWIKYQILFSIRNTRHNSKQLENTKYTYYITDTVYIEQIKVVKIIVTPQNNRVDRSQNISNYYFKHTLKIKEI